jgi:hypothetical protein
VVCSSDVNLVRGRGRDEEKIMPRERGGHSAHLCNFGSHGLQFCLHPVKESLRVYPSRVERKRSKSILTMPRRWGREEEDETKKRRRRRRRRRRERMRQENVNAPDLEHHHSV